MNTYAGFIIVVLVSVAVLSEAYPRGNSRSARRGSQYDAGLARVASSQERRGWLDCKQPGTSCRGFPPCCNDYVCYWENGFSPRTPGVCVTCVEQGQMCQRDGQCCESFVCHKETSYTTNGRCDVKRPLGAECHDNDQCESEYCDIHWYNDVVMGHGGNCANP